MDALQISYMLINFQQRLITGYFLQDLQYKFSLCFWLQISVNQFYETSVPDLLPKRAQGSL